MLQNGQQYFVSAHFFKQSKQTEEELKIRLRGKVTSTLLDEVVGAWVSLLKDLRPEMEVGLAVLHMESGLPEAIVPLLRRRRTPFLPGASSLMSATSTQFSGITPLIQPMMSRSISFSIPRFGQHSGFSMSSVLSRSFDQPSPALCELPADLPPHQPHFPMPNMSRTLTAPGPVPRKERNPSFRINRGFGWRNLTVNNEPTGRTVIPDVSFLRDSFRLRPQWQHTEDFHPTDEITLPTPTPTDIGENSLDPLWDHRRQTSTSIFNKDHSDEAMANYCEWFNELVEKSSGVKYILDKGLHVRELVNIRSGTRLASTLAPNSVGVVMKHSGEIQVGKGGDLRLEQDRPKLTVRLLDGSWLTDVTVEDVESRGERATLRQYLRVGDILCTRFGLATARQLHPNLAQVTAEFTLGFMKLKEHCGRDEIHQGLRRVLFGSSVSPNQFHRGDFKEEEHPSPDLIPVPNFEDFDIDMLDQELKCITSADKKLKHREVPAVKTKDTKGESFFASSDGNIKDLARLKRPNVNMGEQRRNSGAHLNRQKLIDVQENSCLITKGSTLCPPKVQEPRDVAKLNVMSHHTLENQSDSAVVKTINATDIWSVLSPEDIFLQTTQEMRISQVPRDRIVSKCFKSEGSYMEPWEEKNEVNLDDPNSEYDDTTLRAINQPSEKLELK